MLKKLWVWIFKIKFNIIVIFKKKILFKLEVFIEIGIYIGNDIV